RKGPIWPRPLHADQVGHHQLYVTLVIAWELFSLLACEKCPGAHPSSSARLSKVSLSFTPSTSNPNASTSAINGPTPPYGYPKHGSILSSPTESPTRSQPSIT